MIAGRCGATTCRAMRRGNAAGRRGAATPPGGAAQKLPDPSGWAGLPAGGGMWVHEHHGRRGAGRARVAALGIKLAAVAGLVGATLVAQNRGDVAPRALATDVGFARVAHLSPDTAPFDVYVVPAGRSAAVMTLRNLSYGQVSAYQRLAPGGYTVTLRGAGTGERGVVLLTSAVHVDAGNTYTLAVTGLRTRLSLRVVGDDVRLAARGQSRLRVFNAATTLDPARVSIDRGRVLWGEAGFGTVSSYVDVAAGRHTVRADAGDAKRAATMTVDLAGNGVYSLLILDAPAGPRLALHADAAAPVRVPAGPVETGFGGAAGLLDSGLLDSGLVDGGLPDRALLDRALLDRALLDRALLDGGPLAAAAPGAALSDGALSDAALLGAALSGAWPGLGELAVPAVRGGRPVPVELRIPRIGVRTRIVPRPGGVLPAAHAAARGPGAGAPLRRADAAVRGGVGGAVPEGEVPHRQRVRGAAGQRTAADHLRRHIRPVPPLLPRQRRGDRRAGPRRLTAVRLTAVRLTAVRLTAVRLTAVRAAGQVRRCAGRVSDGPFGGTQTVYGGRLLTTGRCGHDRAVHGVGAGGPGSARGVVVAGRAVRTGRRPAAAHAAVARQAAVPDGARRPARRGPAVRGGWRAGRADHRAGRTGGAGGGRGPGRHGSGGGARVRRVQRDGRGGGDPGVPGRGGIPGGAGRGQHPAGRGGAGPVRGRRLTPLVRAGRRSTPAAPRTPHRGGSWPGNRGSTGTPGPPPRRPARRARRPEASRSAAGAGGPGAAATARRTGRPPRWRATARRCGRAPAGRPACSGSRRARTGTAGRSR